MDIIYYDPFPQPAFIEYLNNYSQFLAVRLPVAALLVAGVGGMSHPPPG